MKALLKKIAAVPVIVLSVISCNKETAPETAAETSKISISVKAEIDNLAACEDTKASIAPVLRLSWANNGDKVFVYDGSKKLGTLDVSIKKEDARYAYLDGPIETPDGTVLTFVYAMGITDAPEVNNGSVTFSLAKQDPKKTPFVVYGTMPYDGTTVISDMIVKFQFATAVVLVNCLGLEDNKDKKVTKAELSGIKTNCVIKFSDTGAPSVDEDKNAGTITSDGEFSSGNGKSFFYLGVPVSSSVSGDVSRKLTVSQGADTYSTNFTNIAFAASEFKNVLYSLTKETGSGGNSGEYHMPDFGCDPGECVEIGGILWAKNNLAVTDSGKGYWKDTGGNVVTAPETTHPVINGDYFQWAASYDGYGLTGDDRTPANLVIYESFNDQTYPFTPAATAFGSAGSPYIISSTTYNKYTTKGETLGLDDDAANLCLRESDSGWRMPTQQDWHNLQLNSYWVFDAIDRGLYVFRPVEGQYEGGQFETSLTKSPGKDKAILFFPAIGYASGNKFTDLYECYYWSSSKSPTNAAQQYGLHVKSTSGTTSSYTSKFTIDTPKRYNGLPIRPVKTKTTD